MTITKADKHQAHMPRVIHYRGQMIYLRIAPADLPNATWTKRDGHLTSKSVPTCALTSRKSGRSRWVRTSGALDA